MRKFVVAGLVALAVFLAICLARRGRGFECRCAPGQPAIGDAGDPRAATAGLTSAEPAPVAEQPQGAEPQGAEPRSHELSGEDAAPEAAALAAASSSDGPDSHDVEVIEGIGPVFRGRLEQAGISTVAELLARGATPAGRAALAEAADIPARLIDTWVIHADLLRVPGIDAQAAELLQAAGVSSASDLAGRRAEDLLVAIASVGGGRRLAPTLPGDEDLATWISAAAITPGATPA
jgi:predicted flap endonuclease-1-like 5' DNA nuclease